MSILIGLLATLAIVYQNQALLMAFTWAMIHEAGASSVVALVPACLAVAALWAGWIVLKRHRIRRMTLAFTVYAVGLLLTNELLLPLTPLKTLRRQNALEAVTVRNLRDEVALTPAGHPIGIRITFETVFPETGAYFVGPSTLMPVNGEVPYELQFGQMLPAIQPSPSATEDGGQVFQAGTVYSFAFDLIPNFIAYSDPGKGPCLRLTGQPASERALVSALSRSGATKYRTEIQAEAVASLTRRVVAADYVTGRAYDVNEMYRTVGIEANRNCGF